MSARHVLEIDVDNEVAFGGGVQDPAERLEGCVAVDEFQRWAVEVQRDAEAREDVPIWVHFDGPRGHLTARAYADHGDVLRADPCRGQRADDQEEGDLEGLAKLDAPGGTVSARLGEYAGAVALF